MKRREFLMTCAVGSLTVGLTPLPAQADKDELLHVNVAFGTGLNTAQPGNSLNHHIVPKTILVKTGGTVHFIVSGFHWPIVYKPGTEPQNIIVPGAGLFINDLRNVYYKGLAPAGGPPPGNPATADPSNASNRVESVFFADPGTYLVICNVRPHFLDGMFAFVKVLPKDND